MSSTQFDALIKILRAHPISTPITFIIIIYVISPNKKLQYYSLDKHNFFHVRHVDISTYVKLQLNLNIICIILLKLYILRHSISNYDCKQ